MAENSGSHTPYLTNHTSYDCRGMVHICKMIASPGVVFNFSNFCFTRLPGREGKRAEMVQNDKTFCLSHLTFQVHTSYDRHLWYACVTG